MADSNTEGESPFDWVGIDQSRPITDALNDALDNILGMEDTGWVRKNLLAFANVVSVWSHRMYLLDEAEGKRRQALVTPFPTLKQMIRLIDQKSNQTSGDTPSPTSGDSSTSPGITSNGGESPN